MTVIPAHNYLRLVVDREPRAVSGELSMVSPFYLARIVGFCKSSITNQTKDINLKLYFVYNVLECRQSSLHFKRAI